MEKTDVEGTCFVYERSAPPTHGFTILNQRGINNFVQPIRANLEFQLQVPFLLYRNPPCGSWSPGISENAQVNTIHPPAHERTTTNLLAWHPSYAIYGIWFYEAKECKHISELLQRLVQSQGQNPPHPHPMVAAEKETMPYENTNVTPGKDILQLLTKAQSEFLEKAEPPGVSSRRSDGVEVIKPQAVKPEERQSITIDDLFKNASGLATQSSSGETIKVKRHSDVDVNSTTAFRRPLPMGQMTTVTEIEREHTPDLIEPSQLLTPANLVSGNASITGELQKVSQRLSTPSKSTFPSNSQSELMSPMAFSIARRDSGSTIQIPVAINPPQHVNVSESNMMSSFGNPRRTSVTSNTSAESIPSQSDMLSPLPISALTKEQLRQAMLHLLNNDEQFLQTLHTGYIQSLNASLRR